MERQLRTTKKAVTLWHFPYPGHKSLAKMEQLFLGNKTFTRKVFSYN